MQMSRIHADHVERSLDGCNARWRLISPAVTRLTGILAHAFRGAPSGWNESMICRKQARNTYQQTYAEHFAFEECWKILKDSFKWQTWSTRYKESPASGPSASSKRKYVQGNDPTDDICDTDAPPSSFHVDSPQPVAPEDDAPQSVGVDTLEAGARSATIPVPPMYGPSNIKRPAGGRKVMNERERAKWRFVEVQSEGAQKISAALLTIDKDVEERFRRAEQARHQRDDFMRLHLEAESTRAKEQHMWEALESQLIVLENLINTLPMESLKPLTPTSRATTVGINPQALDDETD